MGRSGCAHRTVNVSVSPRIIRTAYVAKYNVGAFPFNESHSVEIDRFMGLSFSILCKRASSCCRKRVTDPWDIMVDVDDVG